MAESMASSASSAQQPGVATVVYGVYTASMPVVGKTIAELKKDLIAQEDWNVPSDAKGYNGKTALSDDHVIQPGETITLSKRLGEKG